MTDKLPAQQQAGQGGLIEAREEHWDPGSHSLKMDVNHDHYVTHHIQFIINRVYLDQLLTTLNKWLVRQGDNVDISYINIHEK